LITVNNKQMKTLQKINWRLLFDFKKTIRMTKECKGNKCLGVFDFHLWRYYKIEIEPKLK